MELRMKDKRDRIIAALPIIATLATSGTVFAAPHRPPMSRPDYDNRNDRHHGGSPA